VDRLEKSWRRRWVRWGGFGCGDSCGVGENMLDKSNMTRDVNVATKKIEASISFVLIGIPEKNTRVRSR
jgi:hypothetical protein